MTSDSGHYQLDGVFDMNKGIMKLKTEASTHATLRTLILEKRLGATLG
jgi:hypothetical protein